jgi:hypothetical protein
MEENIKVDGKMANNMAKGNFFRIFQVPGKKDNGVKEKE